MSEISPQWSRVISELRNDPKSRIKDHCNLLQDATLGVSTRELDQVAAQHAREITSLKALQKVKPLLKVLDKFAEFAGPLASLEPHGIASIVIGSFRIIIKLASGYMSAFEKISSSLEYIHGKLGMLFEHEPRFKAKPSKRLNNALYKVFKAYWAFFEDVYSLLYSTKHHRPKGLGSHLKDFITGHVAEVESHINGFKELCDMANEEIHLASEQKRDQENAILQEGIERILAEMSTQEKEYLHEECRRFKAWIAPVDMNEKMKTLLKKRTPGTGSWIFRDKSFRSCLDGESSNKVKTRSVLWLTAGPGFGKSSLAAFLADHLRRTVTTGVAYFSVDTTSNETETSIVPALLRTVLDQLFADDPITNEPHFEIKPSTIRNAGHLCCRHQWLDAHALCSAERSRGPQTHKKGRHIEWVTTPRTIQAGDHSVNALLELSSDPGLADRAGNLPIHLAAYHGCEASVSRLSQCHNEWDRPNSEGKTPLAIALQLRHLEVAKTLLRKGASLDKVSGDLRNQFSILREDASHEVKIEARRPDWLFCAACIRSYMRRPGRADVPLPMVARILRECDIFEVAEVERHDGCVFEERTPGIPYLQTPPVIPSSSSRPVERPVVEARSGLGEWAWLRADKVEGGSGGRVVPWLDRRLFHRGKWGHAHDTATFSDGSNAPDRASPGSLRPGDRVALVPLGIYPAWCVVMEHARIRLVMSGIRDCLSNQDRERIWRPQKMKRTVPNAKQLLFFKRYGKDARGIVGIPFRHVDDCSSHLTKLPVRKV